MSPAHFESDRYIERERYCKERERERKREIEIFKVSRNYEEFVERLGGERSNNNNKYLPYSETEVVGDDDENNDFVTYLIVTNHTEGDRTIPNVDKFYDIVMWSNPAEYYYGIMDKTDLNSYYITKDDIMYLIKNELCIRKIRLLFDDGG